VAFSDDFPLVSPQWTPRRLSAAEVVRLVQGDDVPGVPPHHPCIVTLRRGLPTNYSRVAFIEARRDGYLFMGDKIDRSNGEAIQLRDVWRWWCSAAGHPYIVLGVAGDTGQARIRCDISTTGNDWSFGAFAAIGKLVEPLAPYPEGSWLFTSDELQLDGIDMDDAVHITRALVDLATAGRFRPGVHDRGPEPDPRQVQFPRPMGPTERTG
jgi:hypothetical protein